MAQGPLNGVRIVEFAGIGPGPFCGMLLSDLGADVIRIDRKGDGRPGRAADVMSRGRRSIGLNLKDSADVETALKLIEKADGLIEGFRPGVMERNGLGPDVALARNPKLVYGRMTGWGQTGALSHAAGHDLNYIAITGALHAMGDGDGRPRPPLNLVGDYGGGALYLAMGLLAGLVNVKNGGEGQVIDVAMSDGAASLATMFYGMKAMGLWTDLKQKIMAVFKTKTRDEWCEIMEGTDICFAPVLSMSEAPSHKHNVDRQTFVEIEGVVQPAPAPRFSATPGAIQGRPAGLGEHSGEILKDWGIQ